MVSNKAIKELEKVRNGFDKWYKENRDTVCCNLISYSFLKELYIDSTDITNNDIFIRKFNLFYLRRIDDDTRNIFYNRMNMLKGKSFICDDAFECFKHEVSMINTDLEKAGKSKKNYCSYTSKILNMINDEKFPIYDSYISKVFKEENYLSTKAIEIYQILIDTYKELNNDKIIGMIKEKLPSGCENIGYMKILDSVFCIIGSKK